MTGKRMHFGVLGLLVLVGGHLQAGVLVPGATIGLSGTSFADDNELGGGSRRDALIPFEIRNGSGVVFLSGILQDSVSESNITGRLIFNRRVRDLSATNGTAQVVGISATHFAGIDVTADYRPDSSGTVNPVSATRSAGSGDEVSFDFTPSGFTASEESRVCYAKTNANGFGTGASVTVSAVEAPGGTVFSVVIHSVSEPQLLPSDRVVVVSLRQSATSRMEIEWLSAAGKTYKLYSAPSSDGPWTLAGNAFDGVNPRSFEFLISGGVTNQPHYFFRIDEDP